MQVRPLVTLNEPPPSGAWPAPPARPRLLDRVRAALRSRQYSRSTEHAYVAWIRRFVQFHGKRHPAEMGLAVDQHVSSSTQNQALSALLFLYREVLRIELHWMDRIVRAKAPTRLPVVLTRDEVRRALARMSGTPKLMVSLLYGAGLRLMECCRLRIKDVDLAAREITVRGGKGDRDRRTILPTTLAEELGAHAAAVRAIHGKDCQRTCKSGPR
jgi:integrase